MNLVPIQNKLSKLTLWINMNIKLKKSGYLWFKYI